MGFSGPSGARLQMCIRDSAYYMLEGIQPVISVAQNAIKDILNETQPVPVTIEKIVGEVSRTFNAVSYTHLDVYKRQGHCIPRAGGGGKLALAREAGSVGVDVVGAQQAGNGSSDHRCV